GVSAAVTAAAARRLALVRATTDETNSLLPGDELVDRPTIVATRGIDIAAPPEAVWPWVAQLGQERGGFYTYAWLENLVGCRMVNADRINPQWQDVAVGDIVRLHPDLGLRVAVVEPGRTLTLTGDGAVDRNGERWPTRLRLLVDLHGHPDGGGVSPADQGAVPSAHETSSCHDQPGRPAQHDHVRGHAARHP
ncbi:MAG TPA: hypothetical protein PKU75_15395, partial [Tetrasphaera australiensis]|nr:hypothetical protein [Tetrasphaera australiensis]